MVHSIKPILTLFFLSFSLAQDNYYTWRKAAYEIDQAWTLNYQEKREQLTLSAKQLDWNDPILLRRLYLVTVGRIPTVQELDTYLRSNDKHKWTKEVDRLLDSKGWVSHMSNWSADTFRLADFKVAGNRSTAIGHWNSEVWEKNKPWDDLINEIMTASGNTWNNPAAHFNVRMAEMPFAETGLMMRTLTGTSIECAQCHDHPFEDWTQEEFYEIAAFWGGVKKENNKSYVKELRQEIEAYKKSRNIENTNSLFNDLNRNAFFNGVNVQPTGSIQLPSDYRGSEFKPKQRIGARTPYGASIQLDPTIKNTNALQQFTQWMTSDSNLQFSSVITNRMWNQIFGFPLYDEIDKYKPWKKTDYPIVGKAAQQAMIGLSFDLKDFQRALLHTKGFRLVANSKAKNNADNLASRPIIRMSAEQVWDSLLALRINDPDGRVKRPKGGELYIKGNKKKSLNFNIQDLLNTSNLEELAGYYKQIIDAGYSAGEKTDENLIDFSRVRVGLALPEINKKDSLYARASEIRSPSPSGHFLNLFGESDRSTLNSKSTDGNLAQALAMLNSEITDTIINRKDSALNTALLKFDSQREQIELLFRTLYAREANLTERNLISSEVLSSKDVQNLAHAMICSTEFLFIQ